MCHLSRFTGYEPLKDNFIPAYIGGRLRAQFVVASLSTIRLANNSYAVS